MPLSGFGNPVVIMVAGLLVVGAALLGAVMSSTAVIAIFIPVAPRIVKETGLDASKMLLPPLVFPYQA